jgi:antitoxin component YwqK of YwqJK toxin-antitoxin module
METVAKDLYKCGKLHGESKFYYITGELLAVHNYQNGLLDGPYMIYDKNVNIIMSLNYVKGLIHGEAKVFYENGECCFAAYFINGDLIDKLIYYFSIAGKIEYLLKFKDGKLYKSTAFSFDGAEEYSASY